MPVFAAFGWAGEEQAVTYALSQLEEFVRRLHANLPRRAQNLLPFFGLNQEIQGVYLAAAQDAEEDLHLVFYARPMSLELQVAITDDMAIGKALKAAEADQERWRELVQDLGQSWTLHVKQMEVDEEEGERVSYQDLFKESVAKLDAEAAVSVSSRARFLNGEPQWVTPIYLSRRYSSEKIAAMGTDVVPVMVEQIKDLLPLLEFMTGKEKAKATKKKKQPKLKEPIRPETLDPEKQFVHVAQLKPLHIRRGFVNLTPEHWPFFAKTARSTIRHVTVNFDDNVDKDSSVWRLSSNDMARVVLSPTARDWLQDHFEPDDRVQVTGTKLDDEEIELRLEAVA